MRALFFVLSTKSTGCQVTQVAAPTYVFSWTVTRSPLLYRGASRSKPDWLDLRKIASTYRLQTTGSKGITLILSVVFSLTRRIEAGSTFVLGSNP